MDKRPNLRIVGEDEIKAPDILKNLQEFGYPLSLQILDEHDALGKTFIVRFYDGFDKQWMNVSEAGLTLQEAYSQWMKKTNQGTSHIKYANLDYYAIFPDDTEMRYTDGRSEPER